METSLFTLLVLAGVATDIAAKPRLAGFVSGLAALTRPEGLVLVGLIAIRHLCARRLPVRFLLTVTVVVLPWVAIATMWYGSPLPQSVAAKAVAYHADLYSNAIRLVARPYPLGLTGLLLVVGVAALTPEIRRKPELWPLTAFPVALFGGYCLAATRGTLVFPWYLVPLAPFYLLALSRTMHVLWQRWRHSTVAVVIALSLGLELLDLSLGRLPGQPLLAPIDLDLVRENAYSAAGRFLAPHVDQSTVVALPEVGAFGYESEARVLDTVGLVSPEALAYYPLPATYTGDNAIPADLVKQERPDYVVGLSRYFQTPLLDADWFSRDYRLLAEFDARIWGSTGVLVYGRVDRTQVEAAHSPVDVQSLPPGPE
jgi:hypothetical protein